jgi:hypothetical protein
MHVFSVVIVLLKVQKFASASRKDIILDSRGFLSYPWGLYSQGEGVREEQYKKDNAIRHFCYVIMLKFGWQGEPTSVLSYPLSFHLQFVLARGTHNCFLLFLIL